MLCAHTRDMLQRNQGVLRPLLTAALLLVALCAPAAAAPLAVELRGAPLTWHDELRLTVEGVGCSPALGPAVMQGMSFEEPQGHTAEVPLDDGCTGDEVPAPYVIDGLLPTLRPGGYTLRVRYGARSLTIPFRVHEVSPVRLELPPVASSADPTPLRVVVPGGCLTFDSEVAAGVVTIRLWPCPVPPIGGVSVLAPTIGRLAPGRYEVRVLDHRVAPQDVPRVVHGEMRVRAAERCLPGGYRLCLHDGRFAVSGTWRAFDGSTGVMLATPIAGNEESGLLSFFAADRAELTFKVLDACGVNGRWWAFVSSSSTVEYEVTLADTVTGRSKVYRKDLDEVPRLLADTDFEVCQ
jgi:hypothetical protein